MPVTVAIMLWNIVGKLEADDLQRLSNENLSQTQKEFAEQLIEQRFRVDCMRWEEYSSESRYRMNSLKIALQAISTHAFRCLPDKNQKDFLWKIIGNEKWIMYDYVILNVHIYAIGKSEPIININGKIEHSKNYFYASSRMKGVLLFELLQPAQQMEMD